MLAGNPVVSLIAQGDRLGEQSRRPGSEFECADDLVELGAQIDEHGADFVGVPGQDLRPQSRVRGGDARDIAQSLPGQRDLLERRVPQLGGDEGGDDLRDVRNLRDRGIVDAWVEVEHRGARVLGHGDDLAEAVGRGVLVRADHPGSGREQVRLGGDRSGLLASGHRMASDIAIELSARDQPPHRLEQAGLDAGDVGDRGIRVVLERRGDDPSGDVGRGGDDDDVRVRGRRRSVGGTGRVGRLGDGCLRVEDLTGTEVRGELLRGR